MKNKSKQNTRVLITGANGGMGLETTKILFEKGYGSIIMACRTEDKAKVAKNKILQEAESNNGGDKLETYGGFDMNAPEAIEKAVNVLPVHQKIDVVFLQSGGVIFGNNFEYINFNNKKIEKTIFQNVIGGYIVLQNLKRRNLLSENYRVIYAGGEGARGIPGMMDKPTFNSPKILRDYIEGNLKGQKYHDMNAMGTSKLMSALLVAKLAQNAQQGEEFIWFTPGLTYGTNGLATKPALERWFLENIGFTIMKWVGMAQSPVQAAQKYVSAIDGIRGENGDILGSPEKKTLGPTVDQKPMNTAFTDQGLINEFYAIVKEVYPEKEIVQ
ncbi:SDR family NAD(P)-dependent oxidoreductase [Flammeovirga aprica]|uniref:SDR family NAD(P)-dependent oxidoreductase n=1 Tax=Flammeovirga aprica JL-4 TaxID=694437 RepID=A0A7X9XB22_9BACT|nr:SDR family NAD(P)-dependent oxidoreductase [Flammeovirga aprica]NME70199.1 SDR family NAD(P)-dependent oxidoreductase [Flammeovirga aprica JL-4]